MDNNIEKNNEMNVEGSTQAQNSGYGENIQTQMPNSDFEEMHQEQAPMDHTETQQEKRDAYEQDYTYVNQATAEAPKKPKKEKKMRGGNGFLKRAALCAVLGITFGVCSGAGFYTVNRLTGSTAQTESSSTTATAGNADMNNQVQNTLTTTSSNTSQTVTTDVTEVVANTMPSIVSINSTFTTTGTTIYGQTVSQESQGSGSGIIVGQSDSELLIATNNHVVEDATSMEVEFIDGTKATANIKGTDSAKDLAVIAVALEDLSSDTLSQIKVATLGDSDSLTVGEPAIAIGNALGYGQSVTTGVISAVNREVETEDGETNTFIQADAAINPGNSGGALINANGEVIGINSNKIGGETIEGMGYAIPISDAKPIIEELMNQETKIKVSDEERGALGISVMTPTGVEGAYVAQVQEDSAADKAGIQEGDLITKINDTEVTSRDDLTSALQYYAEGDTVTITVLRRGQNGYENIDLQVTLQSASTLTSSTQDASQSSEQQEQSQYGYEQGGSIQGWNPFGN